MLYGLLKSSVNSISFYLQSANLQNSRKKKEITSSLRSRSTNSLTIQPKWSNECSLKTMIVPSTTGRLIQIKPTNGQKKLPDETHSLTRDGARIEASLHYLGPASLKNSLLLLILGQTEHLRILMV